MLAISSELALTPSMITIQLLGGACLRSGDTPLAGPPAQRHRLALLALIVHAWPRPLSRDRAMALLWPERDTASARRLLNLAVHVLRSALGDDAIRSTGDGLLYNPSSTRCDLHDLNVAIAEHQIDAIVQLFGGPLLDSFHLPESSDFGFWLDEQRNVLTRAYVDALRALAERQSQSGDVHGAATSYRKLVAADPHSGAHALALMGALDAAGDRAGAIQHAAEHTRRLRMELDLAPDREVVAFAERLRSLTSTTRSTAEQQSSEGSTSSSIAVLPFLNLSGDPENEYFADGITEDVIAQLAKIRALTVISRASVMPFKARARSLRHISSTLGAAIILDGSVRRVGDRVRIVATLVDVASYRQLWAETYDRQLTDIFAIQTDVALHIASALAAELSVDEQARVSRQPSRDIQAYQLYLRGRQCFIEYSPQAIGRAIGYFDQAIARDASFALAWAHLGMAYIELAEHGAMNPDLAYPRAADAAASALRFDSDLSAAHCAMAYLKTVREFDWAGAERGFTRAIELSPSNAEAYDLFGRLRAGHGRFDEALTLHRRAQELDPLAHRVDLVTTLVRAGRYDEAIARGTDALTVDRDYDRARATLGWAYFMSGRHDDGIAELERAAAVAPENTLWLGQLGEAYGLAGATTKAHAVLQALEERARCAYVSPYHFAYVHAGLGQLDRAMDWLERAVAARTGPAYGIKGSFLLTPLHGHPRFESLLRRLHLA
jgi:serine/threonine-protein kinase